MSVAVYILATSTHRFSLLISGFFLLLTGYYGIKYYYDQRETPSTLGFLFLCLASFSTGVGGNAGFTAAMNTTAKSFPDRMASGSLPLGDRS